MAYRIGVDTGGTFTDFVAVEEDSGAVRTLKIPSTPGDHSEAIAAGLHALAAQGAALDELGFFSHGTTVATNALLEERGARLGLLVTRGFRGVYEVMDQTRGTGRSVYDLYYTKPRLLAPGRWTGEIDERVGAGGEVLVPLDEAQARAEVQRLCATGVECIAVCLLFSFLHPEHERRVGELIRECAPGVAVSLSCEVLPRIREYFRLSTTVVNGYVQPLMAGYVSRLAQRLAEQAGEPGDGPGGAAAGRREGAGQAAGGQRRYVMQSSGGVASFAAAAARPVTTILSGPAAGAVAASRVAAEAGFPDAVSFDMGGTSADIALIAGGRPAETTDGKVAGRDIAVPMLDIHTLSAGGGTLAWVDGVGVLQVGPQSAGADPGPACYGRGGERPTVTDANVVLGLLPAATRLGGELRLEPERAARAVEAHVARPLGIGVEEAAEAVLRIVNARMEAGIRRVSTERGHDLRDFTLVAFGGAGPLHAAAMCRDLGIPRFLLPAYPGLTSALGLLLSDVTRDFVRSRLRPLDGAAEQEIEEAFAALESEAAAVMAAEGFASWERERWIELRYAGQGYELPVPAAAGEGVAALRQRFDELHRQRFGHAAPEAGVDVVSYRLIARVPVRPPRIVREPGRRPAAPRERARVRLPEAGGPHEVAVYERDALSADQVVEGPAIIVQADATAVLYPGQSARRDPAGNLVVEVPARD